MSAAGGPPPTWQQVPDRNVARLLLPVFGLAAAAMIVWLLMQQKPDSADGHRGPEGILTYCWNDLPRPECEARATVALATYRAEGIDQRIVEIHIGDDDLDMVCYGPSDRSYSCFVTRDDS